MRIPAGVIPARIVAVVVIYDVQCPPCSAIARELPELLRVPVTVLSCRDPRLPARCPTLPAPVRTCARPAVGTVRRDGSVRWWPGLTGAIGLAPVRRPAGMPAASALLWSAFRAPRPRRAD